MDLLRKRSGTKRSYDKLVSFLYVLMRDHLPAGAVEEIMLKQVELKGESVFTNGWLAEYSKDIAKRLKN